MPTESLEIQKNSKSSPFLKAHWQYLVMLNYEIDPSILDQFVPIGTELDQFGGKTYVSIVSFLFLNTRIKGFAIPFHTNFEEINLRFYVKRITPNEVRRGVVFIKEIVPRFAIASIARLLYNEKYISLPMSHKLNLNPVSSKVEYSCKFQGKNLSISAEFAGPPTQLIDGSLEEFITEHYWGYTRQRDSSTLEYQVSHPRWRYWSSNSYKIDRGYAQLYGKSFEKHLSTKPTSVLIAEGSGVEVYPGTRL